MYSKQSRLKDIINHCEIILEHKEKYGKSQYDNNAIERSLMIIAEAMKVLARDYQVNWKKHHDLIKMGDFLDHSYASIDYSIVINTLEYDLPELLNFVKQIK